MRKKTMRNLPEALRDEMYVRDSIIKVLQKGPKTIPEIAGELNVPPAEATRWVMAMRRYGKIVDLPKGRADDYYQYQIAEVK